MYRRTARPSGAALSIAEAIAAQRVETLRKELRIAEAALAQAEEDARALRRAHDEAVSSADDDRTRALRLAVALAPEGSVPPRLRDSLNRQAREQKLTRALDGRGSERPERPRVTSVAEAVSALEAARVERARALAALLPELGAKRTAVRVAREALEDAEADLGRLRG